MKYPDSRSGFSRFDIKRNADGIDVPTYPEDPGRVHAVVDTPPRNRYDRAPRRSIRFTTDTDFDWEYGAVCGATVRVLLVPAFDDRDPDACRSCVELMAAEREGPQALAEVQRKRNARRIERDQRDEERRDVAQWQHDQRLREIRREFPHLGSDHP